MSGVFFIETQCIYGLAVYCASVFFAQVHGSLEIFTLLLIAFELGMKVKWLGIRMFVCHVRTMLKVPCIAS